MLFAKIYIFCFRSNNFKLIAIVLLLIPLSARNTQDNEQTHSPGQEENNADVDNSVERIPEDLAGRVCYELEPLVFP